MANTVAAVTPGKPAQTVQEHVAQLQAAFIQVLTIEDLQAIARKLIEQAREGDKTSARLVLKYGLGAALGRSATGWTVNGEAKEAARAARPASAPTPAREPTPEQVMAAIHAKAQVQQALDADILRLGGVSPKGGTDQRGPAPGSPGSAGR